MTLIKEAWQTVSGNRWRSLLTAIGVFFGVFVFVILMTLGTAISIYMGNIDKSLPRNMINFVAKPTTLPYKGQDAGREWMFAQHDAERVLALKKDKINALGMLIEVGLDKHQLSSGQRSETAYVNGVNSVPMNSGTIVLVEGRGITDMDDNEYRHICVIGQDVAKSIFPDVDPLGKNINLNGSNLKIVGVCQSLLPIPGINPPSETVYIPISLAQQLYYGGKDCIEMYSVIFKDGVNTVSESEDIRKMLCPVCNVDENDKVGLYLYDFDAVINQFRRLNIGINLLLLFGGFCTLLASLIGVASIVFITIKERTRDIALRRVLGADNSDIILQVIGESLILTLISGILGLCAAEWVIQIIRAIISNYGFSPDIVYLPFSMALLAIGIIIIGALLTAIVPIRKALKIEMVNALASK